MARSKGKGKQRPRVDPYLAQADLEAQLQVQPEIDSLAALLAGKRGEYIQTRRVNASNARGIAEGANQALLKLAGVYGGDAANPAQGSLLAALKGTADTPEEQAFYNRMAGEQAQGQGRFVDQAQRAELGRIYGNQKARDEYFMDKAKILDTERQLQGKKGALLAATYGKLIEQQRQRDQELDLRTSENRQSERNSIRSAGYDPDTGLPIPGGPADVTDPRDQPKPKGPGGIKPATPAVYQTISQQIGYFSNWANRYKKANKSRAEAGQAFLAGVPANKESGRPAITAAKDPLYVKAALDIAYDGHLSRKTQELLNQRGVKVSRLGVPTYGAWKKAGGKTKGKGRRTVGGALETIERLLG